MPTFYPYLISSLPMLNFNARPPFMIERFLGMCKDLIPDNDLEIANLCFKASLLLEGQVKQQTLKQWIEFETGLRNELVKIRASRKKTDPQKYIRRDGYADASISHIAMNSHRILSLVESEKFLDLARWQKLDELLCGHYFDLDALVVYALKLQILWRWETINKADKQKMLEEVLKNDYEDK
jgi:hypothetical protein